MRYVRIIFPVLYFVISMGGFAQEAVYLIRHAEQDMWGADPALLSEGEDRAERWAQILRDEEIDVVFTTEYERTRETGRIIAERLGVPTRVMEKSAYRDMVRTIASEYEEGRVLIVGHSGTIPYIIGASGCRGDYEIDKRFYDYLFIIVHRKRQRPVAIRLHCDGDSAP